MKRIVPIVEMLIQLGHHLLQVAARISLYRALVLGRAQSRMTPENERLNVQLLMVNAALAMTVLLVSGFVAALARPITGG